MRIAAIIVALVVAGGSAAAAETDHGDWGKKSRNNRHPGYGHPGYAPPQFHSHFQRPYPYHLDYYRMRYGGSYAPYFGNLYGPPQFYSPYYPPAIIAPPAAEPGAEY